jgi:hypothetical protein
VTEHSSPRSAELLLASVTNRPQRASSLNDDRQVPESASLNLIAGRNWSQVRGERIRKADEAGKPEVTALRALRTYATIPSNEVRSDISKRARALATGPAPLVREDRVWWIGPGEQICFVLEWTSPLELELQGTGAPFREASTTALWVSWDAILGSIRNAAAPAATPVPLRNYLVREFFLHMDLFQSIFRRAP